MMIPYPRSLAHRMWQSAVLLAAVALTGFALMAIFMQPRLKIAFIAWLVAGAASVLALVALFIARNRAKARFSAVVFAAVSLVALASIYLNHAAYVPRLRYELFEGYKLYVLVVALVAPPLHALGWGGIVVACALATLQYFGWSSGVRANLPPQEPVVLWFYTIAAALIYALRLRSHHLSQEAALLQERALLLQRFAHLLIDAQHLANTPLQTLENSVGILRYRHQELGDLTRSMERSLSRVREVMNLFSRADSLAPLESLELPKTIDEFDRALQQLMQRSRTGPRKGPGPGQPQSPRLLHQVARNLPRIARPSGKRNS